MISLTPGATVEDLLEGIDGKGKKGKSADEIDFYYWIGLSHGTCADLHRIYYGTSFQHSWNQ